MSIVELVGEFVQLKKSGAGFTGLCPFHNEKTPSFHVNPMKQIFHCFGCHKGGNVFTFLMEIDGLKFPDAVQRLAKRTGVTIEETEFKQKRGPAPIKGQDRLFAVNDMAARYFTHLLAQPAHRAALDYLKGRGLTEKTIKKFRLGVAPSGWNTLMGVLAQKGFTFSEMVGAGLVKTKEGKPNEGYDHFRERLMFPIADAEGNVIGFGARILKDEKRKDGTPMPKYINSPESPLFQKRKILYGLHENQRGIRKRGEALIVEGYMDVIGLHEAGVDNALASMGTALTEEHCQQLKNLTRRVVTIFDPDAAGTEASKRSVHVLMATGMFAKDLTLPNGQDPDEFVLERGAEEFYGLCERAPRQVTKLLKEIAAKGPLSEEERGRILGELTPILVASRSLPDRAMLWDDVSLLLGVSHTALKSLAEGALSRTRKPEPAPTSAAPRPGPKPSALGPRPHPDPLGLQFFLGTLQAPGEFLSLSKESWLGGIQDPGLKAWLEKLHAAGTAGFESVLDELVHKATDPKIVSAASARLMNEPPAEGAAIGFRDVAQRVFQRKKELEIRALSAQVRLAQRLGDERELLRLLARLNELRAPNDEKRQ